MSQDQEKQGPPEATATFKKAIKNKTMDSQRRAKLAEDLKALVESLVARRGKHIRLRMPEGVYVDTDGTAIIDEKVANLRELVELFALAEAAEVHKWNQQDLAEFVNETRMQDLREPSACVDQAIGCLVALRGATAKPTYREIGDRLRAKAIRMNEAR